MVVGCQSLNSYSPVGLADRAQGDRARRRWGSDQLCSDSIFESLENQMLEQDDPVGSNVNTDRDLADIFESSDSVEDQRATVVGSTGRGSR